MPSNPMQTAVGELLSKRLHRWQNCKGIVSFAEACRKVHADPSQAVNFTQRLAGGETLCIDQILSLLKGQIWEIDSPESPELNDVDVHSLEPVRAFVQGHPEMARHIHVKGYRRRTLRRLGPFMRLLGLDDD